ncbi:S-layer homology domain-containing protein [Cohnella sp. GCM10020058]|uniref:S-layer homology domain-containing protein n=1 Tax=Cohnella sp. GCM10020058 TaxID=3317330 RepID=UPI00362C7E42
MSNRLTHRFRKANRILAAGLSGLLLFSGIGNQAYATAVGGKESAQAVTALADTLPAPSVAPLIGGASASWTYPPQSAFDGARVVWRKPGGQYRQGPILTERALSGIASNLENGQTYEIANRYCQRDECAALTAWTRVTLPPGRSILRIDTSLADGLPIDDPASRVLDMSDDGRYTLFVSDTDKLIDRDYNDATDVFVYDAVLGSTQVVSRTRAGISGNQASISGSMSGDGRYIVFASAAYNLMSAPTSGPDNGVNDVFLLDRGYSADSGYDPAAASMTKLSVTSAGGEANGPSTDPAISDDGSTVVFKTEATNLIDYSPEQGKAYTVRFKLDSRKLEPLLLPGGASPVSSDMVLNRDGSAIAFYSDQSLLPGDPANSGDVYLYKMWTNRLVRVSAAIPGNVGIGETIAIDDSGEHVAYSVASSTDTQTLAGAYVYDDEAADAGSARKLVSLADGASGKAADGTALDISGDGRYVFFKSAAASLVPGYADTYSKLYVRDLNQSKTSLVSLPYDPSVSIDDDSGEGALSGDGTRLAYASEAKDLVRGSESRSHGLYVQRIQGASAAATWPAGSSAAASEIGKTSVKLSWTAAEGADNGYRVLGGPQPIQVPDGTTESIVSGLTPDSEYIFKIEAINVDGAATSNGPSAPVRTLPAQAGSLSDLTLTANGAEVTLVWGNPPSTSSGFVALRVARSIAGESFTAIATLSDPQARTFIDKTAAYGQTYTYAVRAVGATGDETAYSVEKSVTTGDVAISKASYALPLYLRQYAGHGDNGQLALSGPAGANAKAVLTYEDTTGEVRTAEIKLAEQTEAGSYRGSFAVPDEARQLTSLKASVDLAGSNAERELLRAPIPVGGTAVIDVSGESALLQDAQLGINSATAGAYAYAKLSTSGITLLKGLPHAEDYKLLLVAADGFDLLSSGRPPAISIGLGERKEANAAVVAPANLRVSATISNGLKMNAGITVANENGDVLVEREWTGNDLVTPPIAGAVGRTLTVTASPRDARFAPQTKTIKALSGSNPVAFDFRPLTEATVEGTVTDLIGNPVAGATVAAHQTGLSFASKTDDEGHYKLDIPTGRNLLQATIANGIVSGTTYLDAQAGLQHADIVFKQMVPARVRVNLFTGAAGEEWTGPYALDWREFIHFQISSSHGILNSQNPFFISAEPGQKVTICADGIEGGFGRACAAAQIGADNGGAVELRLINDGAAATARLSSNAAYYYLYAIDADQRRSYVSYGAYPGTQLDLKLPAAGNYELQVAMENGSIFNRTFSAGPGETTDLGTLGTEVPGRFSGRAGNGVLLGSGQPVPGSTVQVRLSYSDGGTGELGEGEIALDIPAETAIVEGSVVWQGRSVTPTQEALGYSVPLGILGRGAFGTLQYELKLSDSPSNVRLRVSPEIRYALGGRKIAEPLGGAEASIEPVTLTAPAYSSERNVKIGGTALPGSAVTLYAGERIVGSAEASPAGLWSASVALPGSGPISTWPIRATARGEDGSTWSSRGSTVHYDADYAEPVSFTLSQPDGRTVNLDPRNGEAKFPYVLNPSSPIVLEARFNRTEQSSDVAFVVKGVRYPASLQENGVYKAIVGSSAVGPIGLDYETKSSIVSLAGDPPPAEEIREQLSAPFRDARQESLNVSPRSNGSGAQTMSYVGVLPAASGDAQIRIDAQMERKTYTPTSADLALEQQTGVPLYGFEMGESFKDGKLKYELTAYLPEDRFASANPAVGDVLAALGEGISAGEKTAIGKSASQVKALNSAVSTIAVRIGLALESKAGEATWTAIDAAYSIYDGRDSEDTLQQLERIMTAIEDNCPPDIAPIRLDYVNHLKNRLIGVELIKQGIALASVIAGPTTFGVGTIVLFIASNAAGKVMDAQLGGEIARFARQIVAECKIKDEDPKKKLADPTWIYDPSGYVYEVTENRRIEGAEATALFLNEATGRWEAWNADWYGQQNPLSTDTDGRYAWDVPAGKWKVRFTKPGYLAAESEVLTVLPPHFDVNVPMISTLPAKPIKVEAAPGGAYVDIRFDRPIAEASAIGSLLAVIDTDASADVAGTWQLIDPVQAQDGMASAVVRFTPTEPLTVGSEYGVYVDRTVRSFAGVALGETYENTVTVAASDKTPPMAVEGLSVSTDVSQAIVSWRLPEDPDLDRFVVSYRVEGASDTAIELEVPSGQRYARIGGLREGTRYTFEAKAYDAAGNFSVATIVASTGSSQTAALDIVPPAEATNVVAVAGDGAAKLTWTAPGDADLAGVKLQWTKIGDAFAGDAVLVPAGTNFYTIGGLAANTEYEVRLWTVDDAGNRSPQQSVFVKIVRGATDSGTGSPGGPTTNASLERLDVPADGGELSFFGGKLKLLLPKGMAMGGAKQIVGTKPTLAAVPADARLRLVSDAFDWRPEPEGRPEASVRITIAYDASELGQEDARKLGIYKWDGKTWTYAGGILQPAAGTVSAAIQDPGTYAVLLALPSFADLAGHWSRAAVEVLAARGILTGFPDGNFRPNGQVTRAEFAKLVLSLLPQDSSKAALIANGASFTDVLPSAWYAEAVQKAVAAGIVQGADGRFRPNDPITRAEMAAMIQRAFGGEDESSGATEVGDPLQGYADVARIPAWAKPAINWAVKKGLLQGSSGLLRPESLASRDEAAALILRALEKQQKISE